LAASFQESEVKKRMLGIEAKGTADCFDAIFDRNNGMADKEKEMAQQIIDLFSENKTTVSRAKLVLSVCYDLVEIKSPVHQQ
jgi:hypothetical protein